MEFRTIDSCISIMKHLFDRQALDGAISILEKSCAELIGASAPLPTSGHGDTTVRLCDVLRGGDDLDISGFGEAFATKSLRTLHKLEIIPQARDLAANFLLAENADATDSTVVQVRYLFWSAVVIF